MACSMPEGPGLSFLSSTFEGSTKAAGSRGREVSWLPAACDQPFLSLGRSVGAVGSIRGDIVSGAWCVTLPAGCPWRRTFEVSSQGVSRALGGFEEAVGRCKGWEMASCCWWIWDFQENLADDNKRGWIVNARVKPTNLLTSTF